MTTKTEHRIVEAAEPVELLLDPQSRERIARFLEGAERVLAIPEHRWTKLRCGVAASVSEVELGNIADVIGPQIIRWLTQQPHRQSFERALLIEHAPEVGAVAWQVAKDYGMDNATGREVMLVALDRVLTGYQRERYRKATGILP